MACCIRELDLLFRITKLNRKIADNEFLLAKEKKNTLQQIENISEDLAFEIVQKLGFSNITRQDIALTAQKEKH